MEISNDESLQFSEKAYMQAFICEKLKKSFKKFEKSLNCYENFIENFFLLIAFKIHNCH